MRARRPSAPTAWRAISSRKVVYSRPSWSRRTKRVLPDWVLKPLTSATVTTASAIASRFPVAIRTKRLWRSAGLRLLLDDLAGRRQDVPQSAVQIEGLPLHLSGL